MLAYKKADLLGLQVSVRLCIHEATKSGQPKFTVPIYFDGGRAVTPTTLTINSTFDDVVKELQSILSTREKVLKAHKASFAMMYCRAVAQVAEPPEEFTTSKANQVRVHLMDGGNSTTVLTVNDLKGMPMEKLCRLAPRDAQNKESYRARARGGNSNCSKSRGTRILLESDWD